MKNYLYEFANEEVYNEVCQELYEMVGSPSYSGYHVNPSENSIEVHYDCVDVELVREICSEHGYATENAA